MCQELHSPCRGLVEGFQKEVMGELAGALPTFGQGGPGGHSRQRAAIGLVLFAEIGEGDFRLCVWLELPVADARIAGSPWAAVPVFSHHRFYSLLSMLSLPCVWAPVLHQTRT